jgi:hypothetical protein
MVNLALNYRKQYNSLLISFEGVTEMNPQNIVQEIIERENKKSFEENRWLNKTGRRNAMKTKKNHLLFFNI